MRQESHSNVRKPNDYADSIVRNSRWRMAHNIIRWLFRNFPNNRFHLTPRLVTQSARFGSLQIARQARVAGEAYVGTTRFARDEKR